MIDKGSKGNNLVSITSVLELARIESMVAAEEVVDLTSLDVIGQSRDEERVDRLLLVAAMDGWPQRRRMWMGMEVVGRVKAGGRMRGMESANRRVEARRRRGVGQGPHVVSIVMVGLGRRVRHGCF